MSQAALTNSLFCMKGIMWDYHLHFMALCVIANLENEVGKDRFAKAEIEN
jgi:hypothetical protein